MKIIQFIIIALISVKAFSQTKSVIFYNEKGEEISKKKFLNKKDYRKNLDLYFENDTTQIGLLISREKSGQLDEKTFTYLKLYLTELSEKQIDSTQNIVINYLNPYPKKNENYSSKSGWNVLDGDYINNLHKIADINQFWINSPQSDNLEYYHKNKINWITDKENLFKRLFFIYDLRYGNYILIKPDGEFFCYLGEHSKYQIWKKSKKFFK